LRLPPKKGRPIPSRGDANTPILLSEKSNIPMVRAHLPLIEDLQTEAFWQDVTLAILERVRKDLRALIKLIEKADRRPVFTDFEDELGPATEIALPQFTPGFNFPRFQSKAGQFLREHESIPAVHKLRTLEPLTAADLQEIERILVTEGKCGVTPRLISLTLLARDHVKYLLDGLAGEEFESAGSRIVAEFLELQKEAGVLKDVVKRKVASTIEWREPGEEATYRIRFKPPENVFARGIDLCLLFRDLRELGPC
jgi:type I site-specific restriction endonuclease